MNNGSRPIIRGTRSIYSVPGLTVSIPAQLEPIRLQGGAVRRAEQSVAEEKGWTEVGSALGAKDYVGTFKVGNRSFPGKATRSRSKLEIYIQNPPSTLGLSTVLAVVTSRCAAASLLIAPELAASGGLRSIVEVKSRSLV